MDLAVADQRDEAMQRTGHEPILARWIAIKTITRWSLPARVRPGQMFEGATRFGVENSQFTTVAGNVNIHQAPTVPGVFYFHTVLK
jgi:hypothetical protein